ncbi:MAG: TRCF domain-containing protein, partial [Phycisphaerae bacterium]
ERARIEVYRRMAACGTASDLARLEQDLVDAFGPFPQQVQRLLELAEIRVYARRFGVSSISRMPPDIVFSVDQYSTVEPVFADAPGPVRLPDPRTVHLRLTERYLEPATLIPVLRRMFRKACARCGASLQAEANTEASS